jgi:cytochrome P450
VAEAVSKGTFDAVTDLCARLPLEAVADLIGLPPEGRERLLPGSDAVFATFGPLDARMQARMPTFQSYFEYMMSFPTRPSWPRAAGAPPSGTRSTTAASGRDPPSRC